MSEEALVPFTVAKAAVRPLAQVRSTLLGSSYRTLKENGHGDRYLKLLPARYHDTILYTPAGVWVSIEVADAHYAACDGLGMSYAEIAALGNAVGQLTQRTAMSVILKGAREFGTTPWGFLAHLDRYWGRMFDGGEVAVFKLGPKEARLEGASIGLAQYAYFRGALRALLGTVVKPFCSTVFVRELPGLMTVNALGYRMSWA